MKRFDAVGLLLCQEQATLFASSLKGSSSSPIFIRRFMFSNLVKRFDNFSYLNEIHNNSNCLLELDEQYGQSEYGKEKYLEDEIYWIGFIYRYWCYTYEISSKELYNIIKPNVLRKVFYPLHCVDNQEAIKEIIEINKIIIPNKIDKGIETYKKLLNI